MDNKRQSIWWGIELHQAEVTHDTISWLNESYRLRPESFYELSEDLLQIKFPNKNLTLDVGWYNPYNTKQGFFRIVVIRNYDWEHRLYQRNFRKINTLKQQITQLINAIEQDQY